MQKEMAMEEMKYKKGIRHIKKRSKRAEVSPLSLINLNVSGLSSPKKKDKRNGSKHMTQLYAAYN